MYSREKATRAELLSSKIETFFKERQPQKKLLEEEVKKINPN